MTNPVLYSTNVFLKLLICERYRNDVHYVWCSECFDSKKERKYSHLSKVAPSSNPADIYRELRRDVEGKDLHSAKINAQKAELKALAIKWEIAGEIQPEDKEDIIFKIDTASLEEWSPLIYVIPRAPVQDRLQLVRMKERGAFGNEYIISDLHRSEFDVIEL